MQYYEILDLVLKIRWQLSMLNILLCLFIFHFLSIVHLYFLSLLFFLFNLKLILWFFENFIHCILSIFDSLHHLFQINLCFRIFKYSSSIFVYFWGYNWTTFPLHSSLVIHFPPTLLQIHALFLKQLLFL